MKYLSLLFVLSVVFFAGCGENKTQNNDENIKTQSNQEQKLSQDEHIDKMASDIKDKTSDVIDKASQMAKELSSESKVIAEEMKVESEKVIKKIAKETKVITAVAVEKMNEAKEELDEKMDEVLTVQGGLNKNQLEQAESLYLKCAGCHGQKGERAALNKSQIIQGWSSEQIFMALQGYKSDTYGSTMKGVMKGQVANLSAEEMQLLADYIATLK